MIPEPPFGIIIFCFQGEQKEPSDKEWVKQLFIVLPQSSCCEIFQKKLVAEFVFSRVPA